MRRVGVQSFRTARLHPVRRIYSRTYFTHYNALGPRRAASTRTASVPPTVLKSSMHVRNFSLAFLSTLVASGAWYAYKGNSDKQSDSVSHPFAANLTNSTISLDSASNLPFGSAKQSPSGTVQVENDQFYTTSTSVHDQPLSKKTDDSGKKMVGMMTPEQATEKLRRNEESYHVDRGSGVVRYDVVQLPSNDPIEDDHAEKIVEVPQSVAATTDGKSASDWMFWGVFDGHSYVSKYLSIEYIQRNANIFLADGQLRQD